MGLNKRMKNGMAPGNFCVRGLRSLPWDMVGRKAEKSEGTKSQEALPPIKTFLIIVVSLWGPAERVIVQDSTLIRCYFV